ncbi:hypothetical protein [Frankia sp. CiP1_Cm_nod2]|uniref:hypothetical protein n=1 Tax=Frankia sp. CiP1_Cm_nod2 TaxID=2897161 RepID=UPI0020250A3C
MDVSFREYGTVLRPGIRWYVATLIIENCIRVRAGVEGRPISVGHPVLDSHRSSSRSAYCPYETERYLNFVSEDGGWVWPVEPGGTRRHAGSTCGGAVAYTKDSPKRWYVHPVPAGETDGYEIGPDWYASDAAVRSRPRGAAEYGVPDVEPLAGIRGLAPGLKAHPEPENPRGRKEWLTGQRVDGQRYRPAVDQSALAAAFDLALARRNSPSSDDFCRDVERLLSAASHTA